MFKTMPLSTDIDGFPQTTLKEQEEEEKEDSENEKSFSDYLDTKADSGTNEPDLITSAVRNLESYYRAQDAEYWDKELKDMMESVKKVQKAFSEGAKIDEIFGFRSEGFKDRKLSKSKDDVKTFMEEIEKMDAILKVKTTEEKNAKLSRIKAEEESRNILTTLPCPKASGGMKINLKEFMRLLNEVEKTEYDSSSCNVSEGNDGDYIKEEKKEKAVCQPHKVNNFKFVQRNIQLAKCGRGTLSLTDEEKSRIECLLADVERPSPVKAKKPKEPEISTKSSENENGKEAYGIDDETKSILSQIDEKLEMLAEVRKSEGYQSKLSWLKKHNTEKRVSGESENESEVEKGKEKDKKKKKEERKERNRLKKINELLNSINSISAEEINPLSEEEMESLIRESKQTLNQDELSASGKEDKHPHELITELVSNAKSLMPKFKYRFDEC